MFGNDPNLRPASNFQPPRRFRFDFWIVMVVAFTLAIGLWKHSNPSAEGNSQANQELEAVARQMFKS